MDTLLKCIALAAWLAALAPASVIAEPVRTAQGLIEGERTADGLGVFRGIPFAQAPVGDLRWRPPLPLPAWQGIRTATHFSADCAQPAHPSDYVGDTDRGHAEDCLYLNIWTPAKASGTQLPVMVWIYGGGFQEGSAATPLFDGVNFARQGVVLVTINYRVGVFGFLVHPELSKESAHSTSGNYGILDQIAALHWIKDNIAAFGGDPKLVTIFGESAGSTAVSILQASPLAKGLFARAIGESTSQMDAAAGLLGRQSLAQGEQYGRQFANAVGAASLADLRGKSIEELLRPQKFFWPQIADGYVLPDDVYAIFVAGKQNDVPLLVGSNSAEGVNLRVPWVRPDTAQERADFARLFPDPASPQPYTDTIAWQMRAWAAVQAQTGHAKSYLYWLDHNPPTPPGKPQGAVHGAEQVYVFQNFSVRDWPWTGADRRLGELMSSYWINFAKTGDPNGPGLPAWPSYDAMVPQAMLLSERPHAGAAPDEPAFQFIDAYFAQHRAAARTMSADGIINLDLSGNGPKLAAAVPGLALDPKDPSKVYVVWRTIAVAKEVADVPSAGSWECHLSGSTDGGLHFIDRVLQWDMPDTPRCNAPFVDVAQSGALYVGASLMARMPAGSAPGTPPFGRAALRASSDGGVTWLPTVSAIASDSRARFAPNAAIPEVAMSTPWDGARGVIDHDSGTIYLAGGYPAPPNGAAHSQRFFAVSTDAGKSFGRIRAYGSLDWPQRWDSHLVAAHGVLAFSYVADAAPGPHGDCPCVVVATSADQGVTLKRHFVTPIKNLDTLVHYPPLAAEPTQRDVFALALVSDDGSTVSVLGSRDGGAHWQPVTLTQPTGVSSVSRPALAYAPDGTLVALWRGYHSDGGYDVYVAASRRGHGFSAAAKISTATSRVPKELESHYAVRGDFLNVVAASRDSVHAAWTDWRTGGEARVYYGRLPLTLLQ